MLGQVPMRGNRELPRLRPKHEALDQAISTIFSERASFELREDDVEALRKQLKNGNITPLPSSSMLFQQEQEAEEMAAWRTKHPPLLAQLANFFARASGKRITVFMDYDGTLTPIVKDPDRAFMSDQMRQAVKAVARLFPTAIISGRGREKVQGFVQLQELFYAGSHGMDISGPALAGSDQGLSFQPAAKFEPVMDEVFNSLVQRTQLIPGASVEHNKFCVSVHFRNCEPERLEEVVGAVEAVLAEKEELKATRGRKVLEIRPEVEWNKGHALAHLLKALEVGEAADLVPIYIGDDRTDEDAFATLNQRENGVGILVSSKVKPTEASFTLRDPLEVMSFLLSLVAWGRSLENGWHKAKSCTGWQLNCDQPPSEFSAPSRGNSSSYLPDFDDLSRQRFGRPPIFPAERSRSSCQNLSAIAADTNAHSTSAQPSLEHRNGNGQPQSSQNGAPATPFAKVSLWADTSTASSPTLGNETVSQDDVSEEQDGIPNEERERQLDSVILSVADSVRESKQRNSKSSQET